MGAFFKIDNLASNNLFGSYLDDGSSGGPMPASGSGGVGQLDAPVVADADISGLQITLAEVPGLPPPR